MRFCEAMEASRRWKYFDGTKSRPVPADPSNPTTEEATELREWDEENQIARHLLSQRLPDTIAIRLSAHPTAAARWRCITEEFTAKSIYAQNDLATSFY